jgi:hypothetical protein
VLAEIFLLKSEALARARPLEQARPPVAVPSRSSLGPAPTVSPATDDMCRPLRLTDNQLKTVLDHVALVAPSWKQDFIKRFGDYLSRSRLQRDGAVSNDQVQEACRYAIASYEAAPGTEPCCAFDSLPGPQVAPSFKKRTHNLANGPQRPSGRAA